MSRIGKKPVPVPAGVTANIADGKLSMKGPKGTLSIDLRDEITYAVEDGAISVQPVNDTKRARAFWGMQRTLVQNLVTGVTEGFTKTLQITGVGYRAAAQGKNLKLQLGYSHDVDFDDARRASTIETPDNTTVEHLGHRQAAGRPGRRRDPPLAQARALQGQGHQVRGEYHLPQGREEEVRWPKLSLFAKRRQRVRTALRARAGGRPRLSIHRSGRHIYAQVIDDAAGHTVASASTLDKDVRGKTRAPTSTPPSRSASASPSVPRRPASPPSCSIAAASCSMAASRRWPTPPVKAVWSSDDG